MSAIPGVRFDITGASGSQGLLSPKDSWRTYVFPRGGYASQSSTGAQVTFDSASVASRFAVNNWVQGGLLTGNIRQVMGVGGNSITLNSALTVATNDRIFLIGNTQPTVNGGSATYTTPDTLIRQRDDDGATLYTNSMVTSDTNGGVQWFAGAGVYDCMVQDGNGANQGAIYDLPVGISADYPVTFGVTVTMHGGLSVDGSLGVTGSLVIGGSASFHGISSTSAMLMRGPDQIRHAAGFSTSSSLTGGIQEAINDLPVVGGVVSLDAWTIYSPTVRMTLGSSVTVEGNFATIQRNASTDALVLFGDSGTALSRVTLRNLIFDNNSRAATVKDIDLTGGASDITLRGCRWIGMSNRASDLFRIQTSASKGARITIRENTVSGPGGQQSFNSFQVFDCDNVNVSDNIIDGFGAIKIEGSLSSTLVNWNISRNLMKSVDQSNIFCRVQSASSARSISVTDNTLVDCGKAGVVVNTVNANDTGALNDVSVTGNVIRGFAKSFADSAIALGGVLTTGNYAVVGGTVKGNAINGLLSDGTDNGLTARGIVVGGDVRDVTLSGNVTLNCGRAGIGGSGRDTIIEGNVIDRCVTGITSTAPTAAQEGGIAVYGNAIYPTTNIQIVNNLAKNCGPSGTTISYGINVGANNTGTSVSNIYVSGNRCFDDQATKTQSFGINLGSLASSIPYNCTVFSNDVRGNSNGGLQLQGTGTINTFARNIDTVGQTLTQAATLVLGAGDVFGISGTLGAGTSISNITPQIAGHRVYLWTYLGTMGFSQSNTLRVIGTSLNIPVNGAVEAFCIGSTWFVMSPIT
jgi:hypothetical protein